MERQIVKTYSRREPVIEYKPSTFLVPCYPDPETQPRPRESRLNDKTLEIDVFEDAFDKISTGLIWKSPKKYICSPERSRQQKQHDSSDDEYYERLTRDEGTEKKGINYEFWKQENLKLNENGERKKQGSRKGAASNNKGVKRKKLVNKSISDEDDDFGNSSRQNVQVSKFKRPAQKVKRAIKKPKEDSADKIKAQEANYVGQRKLIHDLLTSTPRDPKQKLVLNVQNLSPITLCKEPLSLLDTESIPKEKQILKESNKISLQTSSQIEINIQTSNSGDNPSKLISKQRGRYKTENGNENNYSKHDLLAVNASIDNTEDRQENILKGTSVLQANNKNQFMDLRTTMKNQEYKTISSFVESPLLFDDTDDKQIRKGKDCSAVLHNISSAAGELSEKSRRKSITEKQNLITFRNLKREIEYTQTETMNESSFIVDEWSNEYDSTYGYFSKKSESMVNKIMEPEESKSENSYEHNQINNNSISISKELSKESRPNANENLQEQSSVNCELQQIKNVTEVVDILDLENKSNNVINPDEYISDQSKISNNTCELNSNSNSFELHIESNSSSTKDFPISKDQSIIIRSYANLSENQIMNVLSESEDPSTISKDQRSTKILKITESIANQSGGKIIDVLNESKDLSTISKDQRSTKILKITEFIANLSDDKIMDVLNEREENSSISKDESSSKILETTEFIVNQQQNAVNNENQIHELGKSTILDNIVKNKESTQNNEVNKMLNGQNLIISLTRIKPDLCVSSPVFPSRTSKKQKHQISTKNLKKRRISKKKTQKTVSNKNNEIENLDDQNIVNHSAKLDNQSLESKSFIRSGRIIKNKTKKGALKKPTRTSKKQKTYVMDIVENVILHKESGPEKNNYEYQELCQLYKIKDSRVLLSPVRISNTVNKSSTSRKSKSINKHGDEDEIQNESIIKTVNNSVSNINIDKDYLLKSGNIGIKQNEVEANRQSNFQNENEVNASFNGEELRDILSKLHDPVRITRRRNPYKRLERPLTTFADQPSCINEKEEEEDNEKDEENKQNNIKSRKTNKNLVSDSSVEESEANKLVEDQNYPVFLKPGKSWARSLSIINHFHTGQDLDQLAAGRGKNWRYSVQTVLNMQPEVNIQVTTKKSSADESSFEQPVFSNMPDVPQRESKRVSTIVTSPPRFSRFSMRIIPDIRRSTLTNDFAFSRETSSIYDRTRKTSLARKSSLKIRRDTLIQTEEDLIKSAKDIILKRCKQTSYLNFSDSFPNSYIEHCRKIGEGVYGEVFLYQNESEKSVIKIIPIEGDKLVNCEPQKKFHEILSEIIISEELHKLRLGSKYNTNGFVGVNRIMCVIGKYPENLIHLWKAYDLGKNSENDCPSMFNDDQLYIVLELAYGGQDLEAYVFQNASESYSIFLQTAFTLAVAEQSLEFEHRDLHLGNLLISKSNEKETSYKLGSEEISIFTKGVKVSVIDFTLSRLSYQGCKIFNDLAADPTLFTAQGDYQFDIYRMMRDSVKNDWQQFNPYTNVLWLDYTLDKMITVARYKRKTTKLHKNSIEEMKNLRKEILNYKSAFEFVSKCDVITAMTKT